MCGNINTNESESMQGEWGSCLFICNSCPLFGAHLSHPCSVAAFPQAAKARERCVWCLSFAFVLLRVMRHWTIVYMHVLHWCTTHSNCGQKILSFFQKYTWTADLDRHSFSSAFSPCFASLLLVILKKIGHIGIANTKKWLDQAVFPCWSNYHTLAGE